MVQREHICFSEGYTIGRVWNHIFIDMSNNVDPVSKETGKLLNMSRDNLRPQLLQWNLFLLI